VHYRYWTLNGLADKIARDKYARLWLWLAHQIIEARAERCHHELEMQDLSDFLWNRVITKKVSFDIGWFLKKSHLVFLESFWFPRKKNFTKESEGLSLSKFLELSWSLRKKKSLQKKVKTVLTLSNFQDIWSYIVKIIKIIKIRPWKNYSSQENHDLKIVFIQK